MFLKRVHINDIRCLGELVINLDRPTQDQASWSLILGNNGTGKTSVLQCIAIGLCDETSASALMRELSGRLIREGTDCATIELVLEDERDSKRHFRVTKTIHKTASGEEQLTTEKNADVPWGDVFVCGYGANRCSFGSAPYERFRTVDAVYTLFNYESALQNPEIAIHRAIRLGVLEAKVLGQLDDVLMLPAGSVKLQPSEGGIVVRGPWGSYVPIGALGDGYAAMLAVVCDLWSWYQLSCGERFDYSIRGIVLLDEIEQHLHPAWQRRIVALLSRAFPQIQFVATTHAPLCAIGTSDLSDQECQLVLLEWDAGVIRSLTGLKPPRGRRADQVLTSYLFGLPSTTSDEVTRAVARYAQLSGRADLTKDERTEQESLRTYLKTTLSGGESELQEHVRQAVRTTLSRMAQDALKTENVAQDVLDYEIRRQLSELFGPAEDPA